MAVTYKEAKRRLENWGFKAYQVGGDMWVDLPSGRHFAEVGGDCPFRLSVHAALFEFSIDPSAELVFNLLSNLAATPIDERKEQIHFRVMAYEEDVDSYFWVNSRNDAFGFGEGANSFEHKTVFTPKEWDEWRGNLPAYEDCNPLFEVIEVEDQ